MPCKFFNSCPHRSGWCNSDYTLMKCNYGLNRLCDEKIMKMQEMKRLLKLAADDANALFVACDTEYMKHDLLSEPEMCKFCKYYRTGFCKCEPNVRCQWRYADEVKGMIAE